MKKIKFLIIGNGRLSNHLQCYFKHLHIQYSIWNRSEGLSELYDRVEIATHILLAISDSALNDFFKTHLENCAKKVIHFSGALDVEGTHCMHPLMTFGADLYEKEFYTKIPFVTSSSLLLEELLPGLPNAVYRIKPDEKAYYHSLCVIGGNLTSLLVVKMQSGMNGLGLPDDISKLYVQKSVENVFQNPSHFFTGPLARQDKVSVQRNLDALENDPYQKIYQSFIPITFPEFLDSAYQSEVGYENPRL